MFHCCEDDFGGALLKSHPDAVAGNENYLMANIKKMAVIPVAGYILHNVLKENERTADQRLSRCFFP